MIAKVTVPADDLKFRQAEARDEVLDRIGKLRGQFGAITYLLGGDSECLQGERADFELWFSSIRDELSEVGDLLTDFPMLEEPGRVVPYSEQ